MVGQAQTGKHRSIPKIASIKADDGKKLIFKNVGDNHSYPMIWADSITMSGTSAVVASGVKFHGYDLATYGNVVATPRSSIAAPFWIARNTSTNVITINSGSSLVSVFDVQFMLGDNATPRFIEHLKDNGLDTVTKNY